DRFAPQWAELARVTGVFEFDAGFEANGNYNDSYRWVRSSNGLPADLKDAPTLFFLFDLPTVPGDFQRRMSVRHSVAVIAVAEGTNVEQPAGQWANAGEDVDRLYLNSRAGGFEGLMVKSLGHQYESGKRTD